MLYRKMKKADPELSLLGFGAMRLPECFELYNLRALLPGLRRVRGEVPPGPPDPGEPEEGLGVLREMTWRGTKLITSETRD